MKDQVNTVNEQIGITLTKGNGAKEGLAQMSENLSIIGSPKLIFTRANGSIDEYVFPNLVVTTGRNHIADRLADQLEAAMSHMAIGSGAVAPITGDTSLGAEIIRVAFTSKAQGSGGDSNKIVYVGDYPAGTGTGAITEAGIFNSAAAGIMLSRTTFDVKNKDAGDSLSIQWTLTISS